MSEPITPRQAAEALRVLMDHARGVDDEYAVHIEWRPNPEPLFRLSGMGTSEQVADTEGVTAPRLRVLAREFVAHRVPVDLVDCPTDVKVFYDQAAVERLLFKAQP